MSKNLWLKRFDPKGEYVARRPFGKYGTGDHVESSEFTLRRLRQFYDNRMIVFADVWEAYVDPSLVVPRVERKATLTMPEFEPLPGLETLLPADLVAEGTLPAAGIVAESVVLPVVGEPVQETVTLPVVGEPVAESVVLPAAVPGVNEPSTADLEARAKLIKDAEELGVKLDKRWGNARIQSEIDKALG